jgi:peptidylprolyl isomerase
MKRNLVSIAILICIASTLAIETNAQTKRRRRPAPKAPPANASVTTPSGLTYLITKKTTGRVPKIGETVIVHYTGTLTNGVKFDSSRDRDEPIAFKLGVGQVIKGWDEGIAKLHIGEQAILVIPSKIAYGSKGAGDVIPPDSTLIFVVELVDVKAKSITDLMSTTLNEKGVDAMIAEFRTLMSSNDPDLYKGESVINGFGYQLLRRKQVNEAIEVLKLNVEAYPKSANVYDSLGEAYVMAGNKEKAIENYTKALSLDPTSENAKLMLKKLTGQ